MEQILKWQKQSGKCPLREGEGWDECNNKQRKTLYYYIVKILLILCKDNYDLDKKHFH